MFLVLFCCIVFVCIVVCIVIFVSCFEHNIEYIQKHNTNKNNKHTIQYVKKKQYRKNNTNNTIQIQTHNTNKQTIQTKHNTNNTHTIQKNTLQNQPMCTSHFQPRVPGCYPGFACLLPTCCPSLGKVCRFRVLHDLFTLSVLCNLFRRATKQPQPHNRKNRRPVLGGSRHGIHRSQIYQRGNPAYQLF